MKKYLIAIFILILGMQSAFATELLSTEQNTIKIFQNVSPKVIFVNRVKTVLNNFYESMHIPAGAGSGIIWDKEGHIVTNFHVIKGAERLQITIGNDTYSAKVIGVEPRKDIAVLALKKDNKILEYLKTFTPFEIAPIDKLLVGQQTIAIGNPYGLDHSLTTGVISALGRQVPGIGGVTIRNMIQTDASINPGNSGGPLLDSAGRLIGLNTMIFSQTGSSTGVGFAVPADEIARIVNQIIKNGRVVLAGIGIHAVGPNVAEHFGINHGILIGDVIAGTPAEKVGLIPTYKTTNGHIHLGDIIVGLNGHPVKNYDVLYNMLSKINIGDSIKLTVLRNKKEMHFAMKTIDIAAY